MRPLRIVSLLAVAISAGCGGGGGGGSSNALKGTWERVDGSLFVTDGLEELRYLDFRSGGGGEIFGRQTSSGVRECAKLLYAAAGNGTLTIDVPDFNDGAGNARILLWDRDGSDLTITDHLGNQTTFHRVGEVPETEACVAATAEVLPLQYPFPGYSGNLTSDGTYLWYQAELDQLIALDPATATTALTYASSPGFPIAAVASGDVWTMCHCGGDDVIRRWTLPSTQTDVLDLPSVTGHDFSIEAAATHSGALWVSGYQYDDGTAVAYEIDAVTEPPVLVSSHPGPLEGRPFVFVGNDRWVLTYGLKPKLARIGADGLAAESVDLPGSIQNLYSLAYHGGSFYVTAMNELSQPVIARITLP